MTTTSATEKNTTTAAGAAPVRRSNRARSKTTTYYDEAAKAVEARRKVKREEKDDSDGDEEEDGDDTLERNSTDLSNAVSGDDEDGNQKRSSHPKTKKSKTTNDGNEEDQEEETPETEEEEEVDDDEDFLLKQADNKRKRSPHKRVVSARKAKATARAPRAPKIAKKRLPTAGRRSTAKVNGSLSNTGKITKGRITSALTALSKKVLHTDAETPPNSLVAALLASAKPIPKIPSTDRLDQAVSYLKSTDGPVAAKVVTLTKNLTLPQLDGIARQLVRNFEPNAMHIQLLNLIFRSVGGSLETNIPEGTDLEGVEDEEWDDMMSKVVTVMRNETAADQTLLCADHPPPPPHESSQKIGVIAFRSIYKDFWHRLGHVLLAHSPSTSANANSLIHDDDSDDEDELGQESDEESLDSLDFVMEDDQKKSQKKEQKKEPKEQKNSRSAPVPGKFSSNRFQLEMMRDLISRVTELVTVGQPDLRSSGTLAIFQLGKACMERTVELETKIQIAGRQLKSAKQNQASSKMEQLKNNIDAWKRHKAELEEIVTGQVIHAVFINRYRDANHTIRKESLEALSEVSLIRPDIFLVDTYLKYFGWMTHDKNPLVRTAALNALLAPFKMYKERTQNSSSTRGSISSSPFKIDIRVMEHVTVKFLPRLVDCTHDADNIGVQEVAMKLLLEMEQLEFLDECEDDEVWDSINMKCLDMHSSQQVRQDALYFVLNQLEAFDSVDDHPNEKKSLERLASLAGWVANILSDGPIPSDKVHVHLVDYVVKSLLEMPEHRDIVVNWNMMVQAIRNVNPQKGTSHKEELTKQRVMLRMLVTSATMAIENIASSNLGATATSKGRPLIANENSVNGLFSSLLQNLPSLLANYKSDVVALRDVTNIAPMISTSVLGLPSRKADFQNVLKSLCQLYLDSIDEKVLQNVALTLSQWVEGDHTRVSEVKMQIKRLSQGLQDRLMDLFRESDPESIEGRKKSPRQNKRKSRERRDLFSASPDVETENAIASLMLRLKVLLMTCKGEYLFDCSVGEGEESELDSLFKMISEAMGKRLKERKNIQENDADDGTVTSVASIWKEADPNLHEEVASGLEISLQVLLLIIAQELSDTLEGRADFEESSSIGDRDGVEVQELPVIRHRNRLVKLLIMCFEHYIDDETSCTDDQLVFSQKVQTSAGQVTSDLRSLFPYDAAEAVDPVRKAMSLQTAPDQSILLGGFARWFQKQETTLDANENEIAAVGQSLAPLCRSIAVNMKEFFRREMALALTHIHGRGSLSTQTVMSLIRLIRKENPVRLLESHMACLRMAFDYWLASEPEEPQMSCPTESEVAAFEELEKHHLELFADMEHLASKLSPTLGVVKLKDDIKRSFVSFMKEGIRFSFEEDDVYTLGVRLPFLSILVKYTSWIKKEKDDEEEIIDFLLSKESDLRSHADFNEIHQDDLEALASFKESLGIKRNAESSHYDEETTIATRTTIATPSPNSSHRRGSTIGSRRSVQSNLSNLSPLEEGDSQEEDSPTPQKKRRLHSSQNSFQSSIARTVVEEEDGGSIGNESETTE